MIIIYPSGTANNYYDRSLNIRSYKYEGTGIAPHAETNRDTYSLPGLEKAKITHIGVNIVRNTAAGTAGRYGVKIKAGPAGIEVPIFTLEAIDNNVGVSKQFGFMCEFWIARTWNVLINTFDLSVTGTVNYAAFVQIVEFSP